VCRGNGWSRTLMPTHAQRPRLLTTAVAAASCFFGSLATAGAQTTVTLNAPATQVTDVMIQAGASANTNFNASAMLATRASTNPDYLRRALIKFDTQNTIPSGSKITSAVMTLTVKAGGTDAARTIAVYPVTSSFVQEQATWNIRRTATAWTTLGGDFGAKTASFVASNAAGTKVSVDVTGLVQAAVSAGSSRYTRIALADLGASTRASYREYFSSKAVDPSVRPVLKVVYGGTAPAPSPILPMSTLRVLHYNTHHGGWGTDGVYDPNRIVDWIVKANPDVISMNEVEVGTSWSKGADQTALYKTLIEQRTGVTWYKVFVNAHGATTGNGNLVLSRYPFIATASTLLSYGRAAVDATISVNGRTVNFTSTHMDNVSQSNRLKETSEVLAWETTLAEERIVCGDWNAWPGTTEILKMQASYLETWSAARAAGTAIGNGITHGSHQIDYIFQSKTATHVTLKTVQIYNTANANGIMPSDHQPVLAVFQVQ
jgi:endonuclease/exonuclease/phosphatase family metal-dependent hydrolase